jgi:ribonucleoside-diphosphate reductase alpha chain
LGAEGFFVSILQTGLSDVVPGFSLNDPLPQMQVRKRNGSLEAVEVNKIVRAVQRCCVGLSQVDPMRVASRTIGGLYDGATTRELDAVSIQTAASLIAEEPEYSKLAARLLLATIAKEVSGQNVHSFSQSIALGQREGVASSSIAEFVLSNSRKLNDAIDDDFSNRFEYFGLRTVYDRYLLRHPTSRQVIETPQYFFLRVSCGLATSMAETNHGGPLFGGHPVSVARERQRFFCCRLVVDRAGRDSNHVPRPTDVLLWQLLFAIDDEFH